ncbi:MAG: DUF1571 domain-containing protein [Planctomycetia bacterium]|nr:DUF1571 domain-containing protein [Planctomycetia bacterium]
MNKVRLTTALVLLGCLTRSALGQSDIPLVPVPPFPFVSSRTPSGVSDRSGGQVGRDTSPLTLQSQPVSNAIVSRSLQRMTSEQLFTSARQKVTTFDSYIVRLIRREALRGTMQPTETLLVRFRAKPWSVYFKWLGKEGEGREVSYVRGQYGDKIHTRLAAGDFPLMPAGRRISLSPDNSLVRNACRHPIDEAGFAASVERIGRLIANVAQNPKTQGKLTVLGPLSREEFDKPVFALEHTLPAGLDPTLEQGGRRTYFFHPDHHLPMLITAQDHNGAEAEYYRYDRLQADVNLDDEDFDPDQLWGKPMTPTNVANR